MSPFLANCAVTVYAVYNKYRPSAFLTITATKKDAEEYINKYPNPDLCSITKLSYRIKDMLAIIRMFGGCEPTGCTYELPVEADYCNAINEAISSSMSFEIESETSNNG